MNKSYPVIAQRQLDDVRRKGLRRRSREASELLRATGSQALVYKLDDQLIVERGTRRARDEVVVQATHVTLVDMGVDVPVLAELTVPSADGAEFPIHVTFKCTVADPATVVRDGRTSASERLTSYLDDISELVEIGQRYDLADIRLMRQEAVAWLRAYVISEPPVEPGLRIRLGGVKVLSPDEFREFEGRRREELQDTELQLLRQAGVHQYEKIQQLHDFRSESMTQSQVTELDAAQLTAELERVAMIDQVARDPRHLSYLAMERGALDPAQVAAQASARAEAAAARHHDEVRENRKHNAALLIEYIKQGGVDNVILSQDKLHRVFDALADDLARPLDSAPPPLGVLDKTERPEDDRD
ncbi:hypothetical protein [Nocardia asteroides]|uniref:hypothetical protein n=1 Tax=Nocardia asteroides TaxID=1824 RepID=UPI001E562628|nr:hypothetical protein [Nocardia asteroides]UGT59295.1 hypothetical protein LTT61_18635 [Nocardia asteroides]